MRRMKQLFQHGEAVVAFVAEAWIDAEVLQVLRMSTVEGERSYRYVVVYAGVDGQRGRAVVEQCHVRFTRPPDPDWAIRLRRRKLRNKITVPPLRMHSLPCGVAHTEKLLRDVLGDL